MHSFLNLFNQYLMANDYSQELIERYLRELSIFLLWYHWDIEQIKGFHLCRFYRFLLIKKYTPEQIKDYHTSLTLFAMLLRQTPKREMRDFALRKKLHFDDEVPS